MLQINNNRNNRIQLLYFLMQAPADPQPIPNEPRRQSNNSKKIIFIIAIYLVLVMSSKISKEKDVSSERINNIVLSQAKDFQIDSFLSFFESDQIYEGRWTSDPKKNSKAYLSENSGKFEMRMNKAMSNEYLPEYRVDVTFYNGDYVDNGVLVYEFYIRSVEWQAVKASNTSVALSCNKSSEITSKFIMEELFRTIVQGSTNLTNIGFLFQIKNKTLSISLQMETLGMQVSMVLIGQQHKILKMTIFAIVMFIVSCVPYSAVMNILKNIFEENERPINYSLVTITAAMMWDTVLCMVAFVYAFKDQESLILFIIPAFLLCLLFTNLEMRLMMLVYQSIAAPGNLRRLICKFNILSYGSLMLIYPILYLTNFNQFFFILLSCIIFPQIYCNGRTGVRPDINSPYYLKFLLVRFSIIFYLRCFPYNVFGFKPNYLLSLICLILITFQFSLLYMQKLYGSKTVIPKFLLEPVYNYKFEDQINIEQNAETHECAICLMSLHVPVPHVQGDFDIGYNLMKTPCNHVYHSSCLVQWMKIKMECPQCRTRLPPFQ